MGKKRGAVHVVRHVRKHGDKEYESWLLRRSYRVGHQVKKETLATLSHLPMEIIDLIRRSLAGEKFALVDEIFEIERSLPHGHVAAVLGTLRTLGLEELLSKQSSRRRDLAVAMIVARLLAPGSKLATARGLGSETFSTSLGEVLSLESVDVDAIYRAMDWLISRQARIEAALARRHLSDGALVLYDVTSAYFEGRACPLAKLGHNRDGKKGKLQIVIGLLCTAHGCPVSVEVFEGNTADSKTLAAQITKLRERFGLKRVIVVGDRGMLTEARLREEMRPEEGLAWITALRAPTIRHLVKSGSLQMSLFDEQDMAGITHPDFPGERLIVCRNPLLAAERARKRMDLIEATEKALGEIRDATARRARPVRGKDRIALRVGRVINRFKVEKYFHLRITDLSLSFSRNEPRIAEDSAVDGVYVIRTSVPEDVLSSRDTVRMYKGLSAVERAFRSLKSVDLKVRPIYHRLADRVKAHVFLCMLAYYVEWHMRAALAPILFEDELRAQTNESRQSVVAPATRSAEAHLKVAKRRGQDGTPLHSFSSLLADLATLTRNTVRVASSEATLIHYAHPTPVQAKAFALLGLTHRL